MRQAPKESELRSEEFCERLRNLAWVEDNRRKVAPMIGGRVAYVWLPDTSVGGLTAFNRYVFAQVDKEGAVIDECFNGGGLRADYMINDLRRPVLAMGNASLKTRGKSSVRVTR